MNDSLDPQKMIDEYIDGERRTLALVDREAIAEAAKILLNARENGATAWICGNGGSAATASHFANDLTKMSRLRAIAVHDQTATMMAYGNDEGWKDALGNTVRALYKTDDVLIAFSCSGKSENILKALSAIPNAQCVLFTGNDRECRIVKETDPDVVICVDHKDIRIQEDVHLSLAHIIAGILRDIS